MAAEQIQGVQEAEFNYLRGTGIVTYDTTLVSVSRLLAEVERATGFRLFVR